MVVDGHYEHLALQEAATLKIPTFALLGTTGDIDTCTDFVPGNVNSIKSIRFLLEQLQGSLVRTKKEAPAFEKREDKLLELHELLEKKKLLTTRLNNLVFVSK